MRDFDADRRYFVRGGEDALSYDGDECDPHLALCRSEFRQPAAVPCSECGAPWEGNISTGEEEEPLCDACHALFSGEEASSSEGE